MTEKSFPVPVFRDENQEQQMTATLEQTRQQLQTLADLWHSLDIAPLNDLTALLNDPQRYYDKALAATIELPQTGGKYQLSKQQFIHTLEVPDPAPLIKLAAEVRRAPHAINPDMWTLAGDKVKINTVAAQILVMAGTVYAYTPQQLQFSEDLQTVADKLNAIDGLLGGEILHQAATTFLNKLFDVATDTFPAGPTRLKLSADRMRQIFNQYMPQ